MNTSELLSRAALRRTAEDPDRIGYWLTRHGSAEGLTDQHLAEKLETTTWGLGVLAVCGIPRPTHFAEDVAGIAAVAGVNAAALANILRQEQALAAWAKAGVSPSGADAALLIAAHEADQPPPGGDDDPDPAVG